MIAGAAQALRRAMVRLDLPEPDRIVDTCGTGGGAVGTFNISTAAALVAAGAGARIAKHGNRSFTSQLRQRRRARSARRATSTWTSPRCGARTTSAGIVFMFAPRMHPAMRHVGPVRRELAVPTVMNVVGPLANPASVGRQVIGVADAARVARDRGALAALGTVHSLVVHGEPGLDEISPLGPTRVVEVRDAAITECASSIRDRLGELGCGTRPSELAGGTPDENAALVDGVPRGNGAGMGAIAAVVAQCRGRDLRRGHALDRCATGGCGEGRDRRWFGDAALERLRLRAALAARSVARSCERALAAPHARQRRSPESRRRSRGRRWAPSFRCAGCSRIRPSRSR